LRGRIAALLVVALLVWGPALLVAVPASETAYVEVLLYDGEKWVSKYYPVVYGTATFKTVGARVAVIREDPSTPLRPSLVYVDGKRYIPGKGAGMLWGAYAVALDGGIHRVTVKFELSNPMFPFIGVFAPLPEKELEGDVKVSVPPLPGFGRAGARLTLMVPSQQRLSDVLDKGFFVLNVSIVKVAGREFRTYEIIVPYSNFTLKGAYVYASYTPLYYVAGKANVVVPPYKFRLAYANYPEAISVRGVGPNLVAGDPPHVYMGNITSGAASFSVHMHRVQVLVASGEVCGGRLSYSVLLPPGGKQVDEHVYDLAENTTIVVRFYRGAVAVLDYRVDTPPPVLMINPPFHSLIIRAYDSQGHAVRGARYVLYRGGAPVASGTMDNGTARLCPLPEGFYTAVVYIGSRVVGKRSFTLESDSIIDVITETTTVHVKVVRINAGGLLPSFNVTLEGMGLLYRAAASSGEAMIPGVPYGVYNVSIELKGARIYAANITVAPDQTDFSFALPVYRLQVKLVDALGRPLSGLRVTVLNGSIRSTAVIDDAGRADLGYLPKGAYVLRVDGLYEHKILLLGDTYRVISVDVVKVEGRYVKMEYIYIAAGVVAVAAFIVALSRRGRKSERIVEV